MVDKNIDLPENYPAVGGGSVKHLGSPKVTVEEPTFKEQLQIALQKCKVVDKVVCAPDSITFCYTDGSEPTVCPLPKPLTIEEICNLLIAQEKFVASVTGDCVDNTNPVRPVINMPSIVGNIVQYNAATKQYLIDETCTDLRFDPLLCALVFTNEKGIPQQIPIPSSSYDFNADSCLLSLFSGKPGDTPMVIPVGAAAQDVNLQLDGCNLTLTYKNKVVQITLPNFVVSCEHNPATNVLTFIHKDGTAQDKLLPKATFNCQVNEDGSRTFIFTDGCVGSQPKIFDIDLPPMDIDNLVVNGPILTFNYGGDGNPGQVVVNICDIVAQNCNATITNITANGFTYTDNAGEPVVVEFEDCCTYHTSTGTTFDPANPPTTPSNPPQSKNDDDTLIERMVGATCYYTCVGGVWSLDFCVPDSRDCCTFHSVTNIVFDETNPPTGPQSPPVQPKADGDTLIERMRGATCYYTCVNGVWSLDFCVPDGMDCCVYYSQDTTPIDPTAPPGQPTNPPASKNDRDSIWVCYPNGLCVWLCVNGVWVRQFCKVDKEVPEGEDCCHYQVAGGGVIDPAAPPAAPATDPTGSDKSDGDTLHVCHSNGSCYYSCKGGTWVLDFCKVDPAPQESSDCCHYQIASASPIDPTNPPLQPPSFPAGQDKSDGDTLHVCHTNGSCYYTCVNGAWALNFCKVEPIIPTIEFPNPCCHYYGMSPTPIDPDAPPAQPPATKADGDTYTQCNTNGLMGYTCVGGQWVVSLVCRFPDTCCTYTDITEGNIPDEGNPATPVFNPSTKANGDTYILCHPNGFSVWLCVNGSWVLSFSKILKDCAPDAAELAAQLRCHYETDGVVTGSQVDAWLDQNLEFDSAGFTATNPCCNTVQGSNNGTVDNCSQSSQSAGSTATGIRSSAISANNSTVTGNYSITSGAQNNTSGNNSYTNGARNEVSGNNNNTTGTENVVEGVQNQTAGTGNQLLGGSGQNTVSGSGNTLNGSAGNSVTGTGHDLTASGSNVVTGSANTLDASNNNLVGGADVALTNSGSNMVVGGPGTTLDDSQQNVIGGGLHDIDASNGNDINGVGHDVDGSDFNSIVGGSNTVTDSFRNDISGFLHTVINGSNDNVISGSENLADDALGGLMTGWFNCMIASRYSQVTGSTSSETNGTVGGVVLASRNVQNTTNFTVTGGNPGGAAGAKLTLNRKWEINSTTGNMTISGAYTSGFTFPDFGEYAVVDEAIEPGLFVVYDGLHKARIADRGDVFDGISRIEIPVAAGGGYDPENSYWKHDEMGNRIPTKVISEDEIKVIDENATAEAQAKANAEIDKRNEQFRATIDKRNADAKAKAQEADKVNEDLAKKLTEKLQAEQKEGVDIEPLTFVPAVYEPSAYLPNLPYQEVAPIYKKETVVTESDGFEVNENFDPERHSALSTVGVSMLGRVWVKTQGQVQVGDFLTVGNAGRGVTSRERTNARVLEVDQGRAFVVLK